MTISDPEDQAERRRVGGLLHESAELGMRGVGAKFRQRRPSPTQLAKFLQFSKPVLSDFTTTLSSPWNDRSRCEGRVGDYVRFTPNSGHWLSALQG